MRNVGKFFMIASIFFVTFASFNTHTHAENSTLTKSEQVINPSKDGIFENTNELIPVDEEVSTQEIVMPMKGPIAYQGFIHNSQLTKIINSRTKQKTILEIMNIGLGFTVVGTLPAGLNGLAITLAGDPLAKMKTARDQGKHMYFGAYYPTPKPGLSTISFTYYSKTPIRFVGP